MSESDDGPVRVLLALTGAPYEEALLAAYGVPGSGVMVARRCLDVLDLLAAAEAGHARLAVVWPGLHRLDRELPARLAASGVGTVAVAPAADRERLLDLGVQVVVEQPTGEAGAHELAAALLVALRRVAETNGINEQVTAAASSAFGGPAPVGGSHAHTGHTTRHAAPGQGRLVAVCGPGSPGRTTLALGVADELQRTGASALLADVDTYGPSMATRLGVLDEASGLVAAVRAAVDGPPTAETIAACARALPTGLRMLSGVTSPSRWPELRPVVLAAVWRVARLLADVVVADCGPCLEDDEELAYDTLSPRRNGAALATVDAADLVLVVGAADAVGVQRLVRCLDDVRTRWPRHPTQVIVTRVRASVVGRNPERQLRSVLRRYAGVEDPVLVPDDPAGHDAAVLAASTLADCAPRSPARPALQELAARCAQAANSSSNPVTV